MTLNVDQRCKRTGGGTGTSKPKHAPVPLSKDQLKDVFRSFDCDKDGRLSKEELKKAFNELGSRVPVFRTLAALHQADENGDGFISEDELEALVQYAVGLGYTVKPGTAEKFGGLSTKDLEGSNVNFHDPPDDAIQFFNNLYNDADVKEFYYHVRN
ncbi:hypothetical protein REPUB_Repub09cG0012500 [Reevesia pubescens]